MTTFIGFFSTTLFIVVIAASAPATIRAEKFKVGGGEGWRQPATNETEMYSRWSETTRFHIGDSLRFVYKNDSVMVVDKNGYYHCNSTQPTSVFKEGDTVINLERPGPAYFVSGNADHCRDGQRLMVEVMPLHLISRSPASPALSPYSGAGSFLVLPELVLFYAVFAASINM